MLSEGILSQIAFDSNGLLPVIVQDLQGRVVMLAYVNRQALEETIQTGRMHYYSRSRKRLWLKGEESGNYQTVKEIYLDCDGDALLCRVEQKGAACHTGYYTCFYRKLEEGLPAVGERLFDPDEIYGKKNR